jgi:chromate transport protein ChrA
MFGLSIGVSNIGNSLPRPVYALLSGLNSATVGVIALAAVQLSEKAITDRLTRVLVAGSAGAGILYNALWYFPLLMFIAGFIAIVHDYRWLHPPVKAVVNLVRRPKKRQTPPEEEDIELPRRQTPDNVHDASSQAQGSGVDTQHSRKGVASVEPTQEVSSGNNGSTAENEPRVVPVERQLNFSWQFGVSVIGVFFISFIIVMTLRGVLPNKALLYSLFGNMYLAGTIIFGGGPVVIPLLREYVVAEGWVSPRDFLIGLAIIQGFPGPNFNFAVYLGALTAINGGYSAVAGACIAFIGIFSPGLIIAHGIMGIWKAVRGIRWVKSLLRGINAAAVGLIYTAVYRIWQVGYIDEGFQQGTSLANEPWWVVVTAMSYVGGYWFGLNPPTAIILGAVMGLIWYGVVST